MSISKSNYEKVVEAMKVLEKYPDEKRLYEEIQTEEFLQRVSENNIREESFTKGKKEEKIETAKKLLKRNMEIKEIVDITELTEEEINKLKKENKLPE